MSAPPVESADHHLPLNGIPGALNRDQITDLCNYTVLTTLAAELNKVYSGVYTFGQLREAADDLKARADQIAQGRWPPVDVDAITPSHVLAQSPAPDNTPESGADTSGPEARSPAPSLPLPAADTPRNPAPTVDTAPDTTGKTARRKATEGASDGSGKEAGAGKPTTTPAPAETGTTTTADVEEAGTGDTTHPSHRGDLNTEAPIEETQLMPIITG